MYSQILTSTALGMVLSCIGNAQPRAIQKEMLVGTWKLVSASNVTDTRIVKNEVYGRNPIGFLTYTADGRMMAIITDEGRKPLSKYWRVAPAEEKAQAYSTSLSYAGTFTLSGNKVTHHVEASSYPNWVNTDLVRLIMNLDDNHLTIRTTAPLVWDDGVRYAYQELEWDRMK
jgi:hypothetical protein